MQLSNPGCFLQVGSFEMQPATNDVMEANLSALLMLLCKLFGYVPNILNYFVVFVPILFRGYVIHNLLLCLAHFALLANVTIILNCKKLLQKYHITGRYTQSQCIAVNKRKQKYKK